jgi:uncharacterized protein
MRVIDMESYVPGGGPERPPGSGQVGPAGEDRLPAPKGYGFPNYETIFKPRDGGAPSSKTDPWLGRSLDDRTDELIRMMDQAGVVRSLVSQHPNAEVVQMVRRYPDRFFGFIHLSPYDGMRAVRELERLVKEDGISGLAVSALYDMVPASDRRYYPLYTKCVELDIPIRIYTAMTYANDRPYELGHPRHIDQVAIDFPELRIIAGLGGWPWAMETAALLRRHPLLYADTAAHRPKYFGVPGSGWEQWLQFGNTLVQDKIMVGLSWTLTGLSLEESIAEYMDLPLKDSVKEKWLYSNAARFMGIE